MRRFVSLLGVVAAVPVFLAVPVVARPAVSPHPVAPHVTELAVAPTPALRGVVADTGRRSTQHFTLVGAQWTTGALGRSSTVQVRTRQSGRWSSWSTLTRPDGGPDDGSADARAAAHRHVSATDPLWVGSADGVEARVLDASGTAKPAPADLHLVLVDGGSSGADASPGPAHPLGGAVAEAAQAQPTIYTRAQWGADESLRKSACPEGPDYSSTIKMGFVHHTDGANGYTRSQVPSIIRSIYAYHVKSNGWCDVGYNFLVDRFGRIWEGRYGGIDRPVIGAHTGGFNTDSFGTSLIGTYTSTTPSSAMLGAVEKLYAWKLGSYYRDPTGKTTMVAGSFSGSRYSAGSKVTFNVISGHRDADTTTCPGGAAYTKLGAIRSATKTLIGAGFVAPTVAPATVRMLSGQTVQVRAGLLSAQSWTVSVTDATGTTVKTVTGTTGPADGLSAAWDGTGVDGLAAPPGTYTVTLTGTDANGSTDVPYSTKVTVTPPVSVTGPPTATFGSTVTLKGTAAPGASVGVTLQPKAGATDSRTLTAATDGTWSTTFTANDDYTWYAESQSWKTTTQSTTVTPDVTAPAVTSSRALFVAQGRALSLSGTALPSTSVAAVTTPQGGSATTGPSLQVGTDGTWTGVSVKPAVPTTVAVQRTDPTVASAPITVYPVAAPTTDAPVSGYAKRAFTVTGNAGGAPLSVQLWTQPAGASTYTLVKTVTAATTGAFSVTTTLPAASAPSTMLWRVVTAAAATTFGSAQGRVSVQPLFAPRATSPTTSTYRHVVSVHGTAVPGDTVTLWTRPAGGRTWTKVSSVASSTTTGAFSRSFVLARDTVWKVTSPTGSTSRTVAVRPSLHGPSSLARGGTVRVWGYALPGHKVAVYRRPIGTSTWRYVGTVKAGSTGRWSGHFHLIYPMNVTVRSHGQSSGVLTIRYA